MSTADPRSAQAHARAQGGGKVEAMPTSRDHAKPDDVDRFFGRGRYARP